MLGSSRSTLGCCAGWRLSPSIFLLRGPHSEADAQLRHARGIRGPKLLFVWFARGGDCSWVSSVSQCFRPLPPLTSGPHDILGNDHPTVLQQTSSTYITWHLRFLWFLLVFRPFWGGLVWGGIPPLFRGIAPARTCLRGVRIPKIYIRLQHCLETLTLHFSAQ